MCRCKDLDFYLLRTDLSEKRIQKTGTIILKVRDLLGNKLEKEFRREPCIPASDF